MSPEKDHLCAFRDEARQLRAELDDVRQELQALKRRFLGPKSEKMPPMQRLVKRERPADPAEAKARRRERASARADKAVTELAEQKVPEAQRTCPACNNPELKNVGEGKPRVVHEYVPGYFRRRVIQRETLACKCGQYIVTAPCPEQWMEKGKYAPSFVAHLIVAKCCDSIPLHRLEAQYQRLGIPMARSTMTDLFHRAASELQPLFHRLLDRVAASEIVFADETSIKMQGTDKRAFIWTFRGGKLAAYCFSPNRSGDTPKKVLKGTRGKLVVDAYTGYNQVTAIEGRERCGCMSHARRKIFAAKDDADAKRGLEIIRDLYVVEHDARAAKIEGTDEHLSLREDRSRPLMARLLGWARAARRAHAPKSTLGRAARYLLKNRRALTRFLHDAQLPLDNNQSEAGLRPVALGRKNYLFVGHEDAGQNTCILYSLVVTCVQCKVDPLAYLTDVLLRIQTHPSKDIDELLPDRWKPTTRPLR